MHHVGILYDQFMMHGQRNIKFSSVFVRVQVSDPYVTTGLINVLYICILTDISITLLFCIWWLAAYALFPTCIFFYTFTNPSLFIYYIAKVFAAGHSFKYFISYFPVLSLSSLLSCGHNHVFGFFHIHYFIRNTVCNSIHFLGRNQWLKTGGHLSIMNYPTR